MQNIQHLFRLIRHLLCFPNPHLNKKEKESSYMMFGARKDAITSSNRTDNMTETMRVMRISSPPVKRLKSSYKPILSSDSTSEVDHRMSDHSISSRIREMSPPKRKVPSSKRKKMTMQIALHSDIKSFNPPSDIPIDLRAIYTNTPKERALVLYTPPSNFLPDIIANHDASPKKTSFKQERSRRNSAPELENHFISNK
ncbi:unnamed protein product [Lepeophtheirus salmonis]|uniref:(salmon louse) hypothetical protein n=1 Tax=Lepeophtheirus salmonis TaxID=72036 RepID=A0A7R8CR54_LEPSM|nr:unnamed protein product [Lepeophtheirus salmonis]CAF2899473.1 unnamed protein product [Lepeophtheirus salmonis]